MDQKAFGKRITDQRKVMNMSQAELAGKAGVTRQHLSMIEAGDRACSIAVLAEISSQLAQTTDWFIYGTTSMNQVNILHAIQLDQELDQLEKDAIHNLIISIKNLKAELSTIMVERSKLTE